MAAHLTGYTELLAGLRAQPAAIRKAVRDELRKVGADIQSDWAGRIEALHPPAERTALGYRVVVRVRGISVEQSLGKTTGRRPDWGKTQMRRGALPALEDNQEHLIEAGEAAIREATALLK